MARPVELTAAVNTMPGRRSARSRFDAGVEDDFTFPLCPHSGRVSPRYRPSRLRRPGDARNNNITPDSVSATARAARAADREAPVCGSTVGAAAAAARTLVGGVAGVTAAGAVVTVGAAVVGVVVVVGRGAVVEGAAVTTIRPVMNG
jgi:hypothetical protein